MGFSRSQTSLSHTHGCCLHPPGCPSSPCQVKWTVLSGWGCRLGSVPNSPRERPTGPGPPEPAAPVVSLAQDAQLIPPTWGYRGGLRVRARDRRNPWLLSPLPEHSMSHGSSMFILSFSQHQGVNPGPASSRAGSPTSPPGTRSAPGDPTITKWGAALCRREASTANQLTHTRQVPRRPSHNKAACMAGRAIVATNPPVEAMFRSHPPTTKAQGVIPGEPRANPSKESTLCQSPPTLPKGLRQPGQAGGPCCAPHPCRKGCLPMGRRLPAPHISPPREVACPQAGGC